MPTYANTIDGNEILAKRSQCDYAGNDIQTTYATKSDVTTGLSAKEDASNKAQSINTSSTTDFPSSKATADFVNSSVATNTAKFLGNFTLTDLSLTYPATDAQIETALDGYAFSPAPTNNDYVYVEIQDPQTPGVTDVVKRFKYDGTNWLYEYSLNNSSFTAAEIAAIDSGVTSTKVDNYDTHIADTTIHVTSTDKATWNGKQDAISDLATIRSGAALGATAVQPGDLATVATTGAYSDLSGTPTIPTATSDLQNDSGFITLSDVPAQVNADWNSSSGASEILNKPSIPTATSDLQNDSGFITLSDVPAQVNADWNAVSGASEILNKPTIPSGSDLVPPYSIPADEGKVLTIGPSTTYWATPAAGGVTDVEVDGVSVVSGGVASITMPTVDQTYDGTSTNAQSGVAIAGELATINQVPASTSADSGKVLTVDSNGDPEWATGGGGGTQADWSESDPTAASYIENKPTPKTLTGGTNITVTENSSTITISATWQNAQADWTESDPTQPAYIQHKPTLSTVATSGLYSDLSGTPTIPTVDQTYDGTSTNAQSGVAVASGISDAVAALPTNLTAAQIQALKEALGVDETVLYSGLKSNGDGGSATYTLSELPTNFQKLKVYCCASDNAFPTSQTGNCGIAFVEWDTTIYTPVSTFIPVLMNGASGTTFTQYWTSANVNGIRSTTWTVQGSLNSATTNARWFHIYKIVGVHRIASN